MDIYIEKVITQQQDVRMRVKPDGSLPVETPNGMDISGIVLQVNLVLSDVLGISDISIHVNHIM